MKRRHLLKLTGASVFAPLCGYSEEDLTPYFLAGKRVGFYNSALYNPEVPKEPDHFLWNWGPLHFFSYSDQIKRSKLYTGQLNEKLFDSEEKKKAYLKGFLQKYKPSEDGIVSIANGGVEYDRLKRWFGDKIELINIIGGIPQIHLLKIMI